MALQVLHKFQWRHLSQMLSSIAVVVVISTMAIKQLSHHFSHPEAWLIIFLNLFLAKWEKTKFLTSWTKLTQKWALETVQGLQDIV